MKTFLYLVVISALLLMGCSNTQSLQEYYVDNAENPNFISLDLPASILKLEETNLSPAQREALQSLRKLNVLAFRITDQNAADYQTEKARVTAILKDERFVELIKLNSSYGKGVIKYLGDENAIDEVVIFGNSDDKGFAVIRVLGENMNPGHIMQVLQAIQTSDYKGDQLGEIGTFLKG